MKDLILNKERAGYQQRTENYQRDMNEKRHKVDAILSVSSFGLLQQEQQLLAFKAKQKEKRE